MFRAVVFHPSAPILLADNDRQYREASVGASRLLGLSREKLIGRNLDDFAEPAFKPVISDRWRAFLEEGEQQGTLPLLTPDGGVRNIEYSVKGNVLPVRHLLILRDAAGGEAFDENGNPSSKSVVPPWVQDYALFLLDVSGVVCAWYSGATRIYGYDSAEVVGQHASFFCPDDPACQKLEEELRKAAGEGHAGTECWHVKKDGSRFWANIISMALKDEKGELQGFAAVVRDFSERHEKDELLRRSRARVSPIP